MHGGIIGMIVDTALAATPRSTLLPADCSLVTVEYKMNILAAAERLAPRARRGGEGRPHADGHARRGVRSRTRTHVATMQQTLMMLAGRPDHPE